MRSHSKPCPKCSTQMHRQSKFCRGCHLAEKVKPASYVDRVCPVCASGFTVHKCHIERGQGVYCSRSCARSGSPARKRENWDVKCHHCGIGFERYAVEQRRAAGGKQFCSPPCWYAFAQGKNNPSWTGGQNERVNAKYSAWRKQVIARDSGHCRSCSSQDELHAHHIIRFNDDKARRWDVSNGVTLCAPCHRLITGNEKEFERLLFFVSSVPLEVWA